MEFHKIQSDAHIFQYSSTFFSLFPSYKNFFILPILIKFCLLKNHITIFPVLWIKNLKNISYLEPFSH